MNNTYVGLCLINLPDMKRSTHACWCSCINSSTLALRTSTISLLTPSLSLPRVSSSFPPSVGSEVWITLTRFSKYSDLAETWILVPHLCAHHHQHGVLLFREHPARGEHKLLFLHLLHGAPKRQRLNRNQVNRNLAVCGVRYVNPLKINIGSAAMSNKFLSYDDTVARRLRSSCQDAPGEKTEPFLYHSIIPRASKRVAGICNRTTGP